MLEGRHGDAGYTGGIWTGPRLGDWIRRRLERRERLGGRLDFYYHCAA